MPQKTPTTGELIRRAQRSDREALEVLFRKAYPGLLQAARFRLGPVLRARMDTLDLAQTAYEEALRDLPRYRYRGKGSFGRWLLRILENKIRNQIDFFKARRRDVRREKSLSPDVAANVSSSPATRLIDSEDRERLEKAMDKLSDEHREVIVCRYYLSMSWKEVGDSLGRSEEAAQMLCQRALLKLKALCGSEGAAGVGADGLM